MDAFLSEFIGNLPLPLVLVVMAAALFLLGKGADIFVDEAVSLSVRLRIPKMLIGTTIVSLGTTLPEAAVSVMSAIRGNPDLALGNAVGSIIANTALIIGLASMLGKLPIDRKSVKRQGNINVMTALLIVVFCLPFIADPDGAYIPRWAGFLFLALLLVYMYTSMKWAGNNKADLTEIKEESSPAIIQIFKFCAGAAIIILSSRLLIPTAETMATAVGIPQSVIAASIVALGTSLPELVTSITAVRKGHGELAIGNIIGADILNVLFVTGAAAAATPGGLLVPRVFLMLHIPVMLAVVLLFRYFTGKKFREVSKSAGILLLCVYAAYITASYLL